MGNLTLGWREWVAMPHLGLPAIRAKIDTGARTSALHAFSIETFGPESDPFVRFGVHPVEDRADIAVFCTAKVTDRRHVVSSNGQSELRYIINTPIRIGACEWPIEVSLSNREMLAHRMLLGRSALEPQSATVQPWSEFRQGRLGFDVYFRDPPAERVVPRPLRIALLTMEPDNYSNTRLIKAARERGHVIEQVRTLRCYMNINSLASSVHYDGDGLPSFDAVIPRIGHSITAYGAAVVRQFAMTGAFCLNSATGILNSRDKLLAHQLMAQNNLPMPVTAFASSPFDTDDLIAMVGGPPLVVKLLQSAQGKGVVLAENKQSASSVIDAFRNADANFLVQQFIADAAGQDVRCLVLDGKVIAAMRREASPGDFRSNLHRGGAAHKVKVSAEEKRMAIKATRSMGLKFAGVDILRSARGPLLLEVNSSPGLEGVETVTGLDIAGCVISYIESRTFEPRRRSLRQSAALAMSKAGD
jgi:ribosomal protein S6--L-glutamate ligase